MNAIEVSDQSRLMVTWQTEQGTTRKNKEVENMYHKIASNKILENVKGGDSRVRSEAESRGRRAVIVAMAIVCGLAAMALLTAALSSAEPGSVGPRVVITSVELSDDSPGEGQVVDIMVTLTNNMSIPVSNVRLDLYVNGDLTDSLKNISLTGNATGTFKFTWLAPSGTSNITAITTMGASLIPESQAGLNIGVPMGKSIDVIIALVIVLIAIGAASVAPGIVAGLGARGRSAKAN